MQRLEKLEIMRRGRNLEGTREESWRHLWKNWNLQETELPEVSKLGEIQMDQKNSSFQVSWDTDFRIGRKKKAKTKTRLCEGLPYSLTHSKSSVLSTEFLLDARPFP